MALGLRCKDKAYLAVWRLEGDPEITLPMTHFPENDIAARVVFPQEDQRCTAAWDAKERMLRVTMPDQYMARVLEIRAV